MAPSAVEIKTTHSPDSASEIETLKSVLTSEQAPLARRFRALFALKHHAASHPPSKKTIPAIQAIASAFTSPSALLKHELAYCLGQSRNNASVPYLRHVLEDTQEDAMCRHEAAEALGALGDSGNLPLLRSLRDDAQEPDVVRETCEIAVDRIQWERGKKSSMERLKPRYAQQRFNSDFTDDVQRFLVYRPCTSISADLGEPFDTRPPGDSSQ